MHEHKASSIVFDKLDRFVAFTTRSGAQTSRFGDLCVHHDNDDRTDYLPLAHVQSNGTSTL